MDLIEAKIAEIKNLNLIYIFTTDSILINDSNKYIGARVVYDKDKVLSLDYKNEYFSAFIKKILSRYNKEKDRRNIVLLGDLTKRLVSDSLFASIDEDKKFAQNKGILINPKRTKIKGYEKYLEKAIKSILKVIKNYDCVSIDRIDGFNHKYVIDYSIGNIKKQLFMLILENENNIDFRISNIEGKTVNISGSIEDYLSLIKINWCEGVKGFISSITYNVEDGIIEEKLYKENTPIISRETVDTLLEEDENIISFYMDLCNLEPLKSVMKIDDNCYLLSQNKILKEEESNSLYSNISCKLSIFEDEVIIKYTSKDGLNKYNDLIKLVIEEDINEFVFKKIILDNEFYILVENRCKNKNKIKYNYSILKLDGDIDLSIPFEIKESIEIEEELKSFDSAKQYIKNRKVGN